MSSSGFYKGCIDLLITHYKNVPYVQPVYMFLAFIGGLLIGIIIAIICARCCVKSLFKKKRQDEEELLIARSQAEAKSPTIVNQYIGVKTTTKKVIKRKSKYDRLHEEEASLPPTILHELELDDPNKKASSEGIDGMLDAVIQPNEASGDTVLLAQDFAAFCNFEDDLRDERLISLAEIFHIYLNKLKHGGKIDQATYEELVKNSRQRMKKIKQTLDAEMQVAKEEISESLDPEDVKQKKLDDLPSRYNARLSEMVVDEETEIRKDIMRYNALTEEEANALMAALVVDMTEFEKKMASEQGRQAAVLEERLARRRYLLSQQKVLDNEVRDEAYGHIEVQEQQLDEMVRNGTITSETKDELLDKYAKDQLRLKEAHEQSMLEQKKNLEEKLRAHREKKIQDLEYKQTNFRIDFLRKNDNMLDVKDFVVAFNNLNDQQRAERDTLIAELDQHECQTIEKDRRKFQQDREAQVHDIDQHFLVDIQARVSMGSADAERLMRTHEQQMELWRRQKDADKLQSEMKLKEKLAARQARMEEEQSQAALEQQALKEQQEATLKKTMNLQIDMTDDTKNRIMKEHEQNSAALSNQIQMSRTRQQKQLEAKLAARRANIAKLEEQREQNKADRTANRAADREQTEKTLVERIEKEEEMLNASRERALQQLRDSLAQETQKALEIQEQQMGQLIGRLQVGQARRQNIIQKQDAMIEELQSQLEKKVAESGDGINSNQLDQLLQQHANQVEHLSEQLASNRKRQERALTEKLEQKRMMKSNEVKQQVDSEANQTIDNMEKMGIGSRVANVLMEQALDQKHRNSMREMEQELQVELQKQREEMNRNMEMELQNALEEQRKNLLSQLASITDLSKNEINALVRESAERTGEDPNAARELSRQLAGDSDSDDRSYSPTRRKKKKRGLRGAGRPPSED